MAAKITSWCIRFIALFSVLLILQGTEDIGPMGCVLISIVAVVWAVCAYIDAGRGP